jgi:hypothetical protein
LIAGFKSSVNKQINGIRDMSGNLVWQRNYYEHIIRNDNELNSIREYINNNPVNWETFVWAQKFEPVKTVKNIVILHIFTIISTKE